MYQYFFILKQQMTRHPSLSLGKLLWNQPKPIRTNGIAPFGRMLILGRKAGGRQLEFILKGQKKVQLTRLRFPPDILGSVDTLNGVLGNAQLSWLFLKSTTAKSCGGWVGTCKSNEHITTLSLTLGFNDTQKGGAFVSERHVHESCLKFAFRNVGPTAVDLKQISARNENGFNSNLKRDKWLEKTNPADKSGKCWRTLVSLEIHLEQ